MKALLALLNELLKMQALDRLCKGIEQLNLAATDAQLDQVMRYLALLMQWNRVYNLTAVREPMAIVNLHFLDAIAMIPALRQQRLPTHNPKLLDVGAGAGLPGLILAIFHPDWHIDLIDAVNKKTAFMQQVVASLSLPHVKIFHGRVEKLHLSKGSVRYDVITSRAFSSLGNFVSLSANALASNGFMAAMQGKENSANASENSLTPGWRLVERIPLAVPCTPVERHLAIVRRV